MHVASIASDGTMDTMIDQPDSRPMTVDINQKSTLQRADKLYQQIDKIISKNHNLLQPLEQKIQREIIKRQFNQTVQDKVKGNGIEDQTLKHISRINIAKERSSSRGEANFLQPKLISLNTGTRSLPWQQPKEVRLNLMTRNPLLFSNSQHLLEQTSTLVVQNPLKKKLLYALKASKSKAFANATTDFSKNSNGEIVPNNMECTQVPDKVQIKRDQLNRDLVSTTLSVKRMGMSILSCGSTKNKTSHNKYLIAENDSTQMEFDDRDSVSVELNPPIISPKFARQQMNLLPRSQALIKHKNNFSRGTTSKPQETATNSLFQHFPLQPQH